MVPELADVRSQVGQVQRALLVIAALDRRVEDFPGVELAVLDDGGAGARAFAQSGDPVFLVRDDAL